MKYSNFQSLNSSLLVLCFLFLQENSHAQNKTLELGVPIYFFPEWNIKQVKRFNIGQLYYSNNCVIGKKTFRYSIDANLTIQSYEEFDRVDRVLVRELFCSNLRLGKNLLKTTNKRNAIYVNIGITNRVGAESYRRDFEGYGREVYIVANFIVKHRKWLYKLSSDA